MLVNNDGGIACGWSETMYTSLSDPSAVRALCQSWITGRSKILSSAFQIMGVRISTDSATPPVYSSLYLPSSPVTGNIGSSPDYPNTSALISLQSGQSRDRRDLRGFPDSMIESPTGSRTITLTSAGRGLLANYITSLTNLSLGWRRLKRQGDAGFLAVPVAGLRIDAGQSNVSLTGAFPLGMRDASKGSIRVRGFRSQRAALNGVYSTDSYDINAGAVILPRQVAESVVLDYVPNTAQVIQQAYIYASVTGGQFERISSHKTGRPFAQLRGRR